MVDPNAISNLQIHGIFYNIFLIFGAFFFTYTTLSLT